MSEIIICLATTYYTHKKSLRWFCALSILFLAVTGLLILKIFRTSNEFQDVVRIDHKTVATRIGMTENIVVLILNPNSRPPSSLLNFIGLRNLEAYREVLSPFSAQAYVFQVEASYILRSTYKSRSSRGRRAEIFFPLITNSIEINRSGLTDVGDIYRSTDKQFLPRFIHFDDRGELNSYLRGLNFFVISQLLAHRFPLLGRIIHIFDIETEDRHCCESTDKSGYSGHARRMSIEQLEQPNERPDYLLAIFYEALAGLSLLLTASCWVAACKFKDDLRGLGLILLSFLLIPLCFIFTDLALGAFDPYLKFVTQLR
jgi:hypothetical protein